MSRGIESRLRKLEAKRGCSPRNLSTAELHADMRRYIDELGGPEAAYCTLVKLRGENEADDAIRWYHAGPDELHWFGASLPTAYRPGARPRDPLR